jgi:hypothetical protein
MSALGHFLPFKPIVAQRQLLGGKQPFGSRILEGNDLNTYECLLSPIAAVHQPELLKI